MSGTDESCMLAHFEALTQAHETTYKEIIGHFRVLAQTASRAAKGESPDKDKEYNQALDSFNKNYLAKVSEYEKTITNLAAEKNLEFQRAEQAKSENLKMVHTNNLAHRPERCGETARVLQKRARKHARKKRRSPEPGCEATS